MIHQNENHYAIQYCHPIKSFMQIGLASSIIHILILLTMFYHSNNYISCIMFEYVWFNATITMFLLIEHVIWLHLLWTFARPPYTTLTVSFIGVLLLVTSWIMEVVVPIEPDEHKYHKVFAITFVVGCVITSCASLALLPGKKQNYDPTYKYVAWFFVLASICTSFTWFALWSMIQIYNTVVDWHINIYLQITAYCAYLGSLAVVFNWAVSL